MAIWDLIWKSLTTPRMTIADETDLEIARRSAGKPPITVNLPRSPYAPKPKKVSKAYFEAMVMPRAQLLAAGQEVSAMHYTLARQQLLQELAKDNTVVEQGSLDDRIARQCIVRKRIVRGPNAYGQMVTVVCVPADQQHGSDERGADKEAGGRGKI
jgi:hypothetical protein